ncbi:hypothetical protein BJ912DRAFT_921466 [Pholiota molesta]|nr:hypothetical protein BJ912DRAFT_921466 [Pholiota molesta]
MDHTTSYKAKFFPQEQQYYSDGGIELHGSSKRHRKRSRVWLRANGYASDDSVMEVEPPAAAFVGFGGLPAASTPASTCPSTPAPTASEPATAPTTRTSTPAPSVSAVELSASTAQGRHTILDKRFQNVSDEDALKEQMATWKSETYKHFKLPPKITCNVNGAVHLLLQAITRARHNDSTSNLPCHDNECRPQDSTQTRALTAYAQGSKYSQAKHHMKIAFHTNVTSILQLTLKNFLPKPVVYDVLGTVFRVVPKRNPSNFFQKKNEKFPIKYAIKDQTHDLVPNHMTTHDCK